MNHILNNRVQVQQLGVIDYEQALNTQIDLFNQIVQLKITNRTIPESLQKPTPNYLIFCQHPHVYTLGKSGKESNLLISQDKLAQLNASYYPISRGGDITYHGPGQIVGYPIFDLENFFADIHQYLRFIEEAVIRTLAEYTIEAGRIPGLTGVWIDHLSDKARKICAIGVKTSRWVTMHGFAFNINTDLSYFDYIIPCGINDKSVTSLSHELGKQQDLREVEDKLQYHLSTLLGLQIEK
ncbi:lipoyl(octanoyl) transferase LipB [Rhodocytophaga rosea]|uniref:Octanoyltransferase n=1 Tax=Rhodocytophaga rosea TaxID=2704465 RepID=A0A6C0GHG6_9BACT|nr:lipoyl(octanoyl) transferase LipB [Rhodocytophaga rosea]QHT67132.1 lipoyl(octanoyl) transferase LipB [Rhodocytophaga rosea]